MGRRSFFARHRIWPFLFTGGSGALLNLGVTAVLTEFVLGRGRYFLAYIAGLSVNIVYNFVLHTRITFGTDTAHVRRFALFLLYSLAMTFLQALVVRTVVAKVGVDFYLLVIAGVILVFSVVTYLVYRFWLFRRAGVM